MARIDGWEDRLLTVLAEEMAANYEPGQHDCFVMACRTVEALTGEHPYPGVFYTTDSGAVKALRKRGFDRLGDAMAALFPEREAGYAQRGDLAILAADTQAHDTLGVVMDGMVLVRVGHKFQRRPLCDARLILAVE
jgi:hypothetical protein